MAICINRNICDCDEKDKEFLNGHPDHIKGYRCKAFENYNRTGKSKIIFEESCYCLADKKHKELNLQEIHSQGFKLIVFGAYYG